MDFVQYGQDCMAKRLRDRKTEFGLPAPLGPAVSGSCGRGQEDDVSKSGSIPFGSSRINMQTKLEIVIQKVFNNPVELLFYQSKVKCYLFAYKWQPFTWSLTIPIACI